MTATIRLPGVSDDEFRLVNRLLEKIDQKTSRNRLRVSYYDGKHLAKQVSQVMPPQYQKLGMVLGWSAKSVDLLADRCNLDAFVWAEGDIDSLGVQDVWDDNSLASEINSSITSSLIHSVAFLINTEGDAGEPDSLISVKDAMNATGDWNVRTRKLDNLLSIVARDDEGSPTSLALYLDGQTLSATKERGKWTVERQEHPWGVPVEALVFKPRVGRPFGSSRISRPAMSAHDMALRTVIRMEGHADVFSYPEMWLLGGDPSIMKNPDGSMKSAWQMMLGRIKAVPDNPEPAMDDATLARPDVKQFQAQSPTPHIEQLKLQAALFANETNIPISSFMPGEMANPTSSDSYIASREDLIALAESATDNWSLTLRRSMIRALAIKNGLAEIPAEWKTIDTKWRSPVHLSRAAVADAGQKTVAAIPWLADTEVGLEMMGLTDQQIDRAMSEKRRAQGRSVLETLQQRMTSLEAPGTTNVTNVAQQPQQVNPDANAG